jgi:hypothetical protein
MSSSMGLYSHGMHDFILRECEVGTRVAMAEDDELNGMGPLLDLQYREYIQYMDKQMELAGVHVI